MPTSAPPPVTVPRTRVAGPKFRTATFCGAAVLPRVTVPSAIDGGVHVISGAGAPPPVPVSGTVTVGVAGSFEGMSKLAVLAPELVGANLRPTVHDWVGARVWPEHRSFCAAFLNMPT